MILGDLIKKYRQETGTSMEDFAKRCGLSKAYISILERNRNPVNNKEVVPSLETIKSVSSAIGMDFNDVISLLDGNQPVDLSSNGVPDGFSPMPDTAKIPRIGRIACGEPITAKENIEGYDEVLKSWHADFTLVCCGDSMLPKIEDGDIVAIRSQPTVENGEIAAVRIGDEATLKQVFIHPDYVELRPINASYQSIIRRKSEMDEIRIEGKAVGLCRNL